VGPTLMSLELRRERRHRYADHRLRLLPRRVIRQKTATIEKTREHLTR